MRRPLILAIGLALATSLTAPAAGSTPAPEPRLPTIGPLLESGICGASATGPCVKSGDQPAEAVGSTDAGDPPIRFEATGTMGTPRWLAALAPRGDGAWFRVHGFGHVATHAPEGPELWSRSARSLLDDWGVTPTWRTPYVLLGTAPEQPMALWSERPFDAADLTGDGVADLATGHFVERSLSDQVVERLSVVTVFDGRTGETVWHHLLPGYVTQVVALDGRLVVANETGDRIGAFAQIGEDGTRSRLLGFRFTSAGGGVQGQQDWSLSTDSAWARWLGAVDAGDAGVATSWSPQGSSPSGHVLLVDPETGDLRWEVDVAAHPRRLRLDPGRGAVVAHLQQESSAGLSYALAGLDLATGTEVARIERPDSVLTALEVADVVGGPEAEWLVADFARTPGDFAIQNDVEVRIEPLDPGTGEPAWTWSVPSGSDFVAGRSAGAIAHPDPLSLVQVGDRVVVGLDSQFGDALLALDATDGAQAWERFGTDLPHPLYLEAAGNDVLGMTEDHELVRTAPGGEELARIPILSNAHAIAHLELTGDGIHDLIVGADNGGVWALDGTGLSDDPTVLWSAHLGGGVRQLELADLDGDGAAELVAAASSVLAVLRPEDGMIIAERTFSHHDLVWTFEVADLDGTGPLEMVVPTRTLAAFRGPELAPVWEYRPLDDATTVDVPTSVRVTTRFSTPAVTSDGVVVSQFHVDTPDLLATHYHRVAVGLDAATGEPLWSNRDTYASSTPLVWRSTAAGPPTGSGSTQVALAHYARSSPITGAYRPLIDVVDSQTGESIYRHPLEEALTFQGLRHDPDYGFIEYDRVGTAVFDADGFTEVAVGATTDYAVADFGANGRRFLRAWRTIDAFPTDTPRGAQGDEPPPSARWERFDVGAVEAADLDGDGTDEVIAMQFDWPGYTMVSAFADIGVSGEPAVMHGFGVLEAVEA